MNWYSTQQVADKCGVSQRTASRWAHRKEYQSYVRYHKGVYEFNEDFFTAVINNKTSDTADRLNVSSPNKANSIGQNSDTQSDNKTSVVSGDEWEGIRKADEIILPKNEYFELVRYITDTSNYKSKYEELEKQSEARVQDLKETISKAQEDIHYYRGQIAHLQGQMDKLLMSARERNFIDYTTLQKDIIRQQSDTESDNTTSDELDVVLNNKEETPKTFMDFLNRTRG
jgi:hypothetical protein